MQLCCTCHLPVRIFITLAKWWRFWSHDAGRWQCRQVCWHSLTNMIRLAAVVGDRKCTAASWLFTQDEWVTQNACFNPSAVSKSVNEKKYDWQQKDVSLVRRFETPEPEICYGQQWRHNHNLCPEHNQRTSSRLYSAVSAEMCGDILQTVTNLLMIVVNWELTNGGRLKKVLKQPLSHFCHSKNVKGAKHRKES